MVTQSVCDVSLSSIDGSLFSSWKTGVLMQKAWSFCFLCADTHETETASNVTLMAEEGREVQMWCRAGSANDIIWWKGSESRLVLNGDVLPEYQDRMSFDAAKGILTIHEAQLSDSGVYWCSGGFVRFQVQLAVSGKLQFNALYRPTPFAATEIYSLLPNYW